MESTSPSSSAVAAAPILAVRDLEISRGRGSGAFRLSVPDFDLAPGEAVACIGPSGCGKTTLLHAMTGIIEPRRGSVHLEGRDLTRMSSGAARALRLRRVGLVFQDFELLDYLSAGDNIMLPVRLAGDALAPARARLDELAPRLGIEPLLRRRPSRLSHGERQRVAVARALIAAPALVGGDEPTASLDPDRAADTVDLILAAARSIGASVFVVTHDPGILHRFDRVLDLGTVLAGGGHS